MTEKLLSIMIGYLFGCVLTAEIVAHAVAGKKASELGETGNPGMANIMASLGFLPGIITLAGDLGKCIAAALISYELFHDSGWIVTLYAGLGCTLGHDFPFWRRFRGGKGVATTSMGIGLYSFLPGLIANIIGMIIVFLTKYLCIGGPAIPFFFMLWLLAVGDAETAVVSAVLTLLSLMAHGPAIKNIKMGKTKETDVIGAIRKKVKNDRTQNNPQSRKGERGDDAAERLGKSK